MISIWSGIVLIWSFKQPIYWHHISVLMGAIPILRLRIDPQVPNYHQSHCLVELPRKPILNCEIDGTYLFVYKKKEEERTSQISPELVDILMLKID